MVVNCGYDMNLSDKAPARDTFGRKGQAGSRELSPYTGESFLEGDR